MSTICRDQRVAPSITVDLSVGELDSILTGCACTMRAEPREPNTCVR
jgi:hypothetical protein